MFNEWGRTWLCSDSSPQVITDLSAALSWLYISGAHGSTPSAVWYRLCVQCRSMLDQGYFIWLWFYFSVLINLGDLLFVITWPCWPKPFLKKLMVPLILRTMPTVKHRSHIAFTLSRKSLTCFVITKPRGSVVITKPLASRMSLRARKASWL